jgi:hypothetical protein
MSDQPTTSLRRPALLSLGLLLLGVAALGVRQAAVYRSIAWDQYREHLANRAVSMARYAAAHKVWPFPAPEQPAALRVRDVLGYGVVTGLTILMVGVLALALVAVGRRRLWLPVAFGGLCLGEASAVVTSYQSWASWLGVAASLAVVAVAALPLLAATRGRRVEHPPILPASWGATLVLGVLAVDWVWVQRFNGPVQPRPAPTLALLVGCALLAPALRPRLVPVLLLGAVLAVPQLQYSLGDLVANGRISRLDFSHEQLGPLLFTLGVALAGLGIGRYGARAVATWRVFARRGPALHLHRAENAAA